MKAPRIITRTTPLPGMSVRDTPQAIGSAKIAASTVVSAAYNSELPSASKSRTRP